MLHEPVFFIIIFLFLVCFFGGPYPVVIMVYSWLDDQGSFLMFRESYAVKVANLEQVYAGQVPYLLTVLFPHLTIIILCFRKVDLEKSVLGFLLFKSL